MTVVNPTPTGDSIAERGRSGPVWGPGASWWHYRELYLALVTRDLRARYKGSWLGFAWTLVNPLLLMVVYTLLFSVIVRVRIPNYPVFVLAALLPWLWFHGALSYSVSCVLTQASLIRRVAFPTAILPLVAVTTPAIHFLAALPVLFVFAAWWGIGFGPSLLLLPLLIALQFLLTLGLGLILAALDVFFRDVEHLLPLLLMVWMYLTPVLYGEWMVPERYRFITWLNPMSPLIVSYRAVLFDGRWPAPGGLAAVAAWAIGWAVLGWWFFATMRRRIAEAV